MTLSSTSAFAIVVANVIAVLFAPVYAGSHNGTPFRANLIQMTEISTLTFHVITPLVLAVLALAPWKPAVRIAAIGLFWLYCIAGAWTLGMLYLPSAIAITWMTRRSVVTAVE